MEKPCNCCVYKDDEFCSCENLSRYELYVDTYNQALEDFITEIERQTTFYCGKDSHLRQILEQLKR